MPQLSINSEKNTIDEIFLTDFNPLSSGLNSVESFHHGLYHLYNDNLADAKDDLTNAVNNTEPMDASYFEYISYLGLVEVYFHDSRGGLIRCYEALEGFSKTPTEFYINLARAELLMGDRRRSVLAIDKYLAQNPGLNYAKQLNECIGIRKSSNFKIIKQRKNVFGKFFRKNNNQCLKTTLDKIFHDILSKKLESFIETKA